MPIFSAIQRCVYSIQNFTGGHLEEIWLDKQAYDGLCYELISTALRNTREDEDFDTGVKNGLVKLQINGGEVIVRRKA